MAEEVDYDAVAEMTDGMVGAQLANILDVAALAVLRDRRPEVGCKFLSCEFGQPCSKV